MMDHVAIMKKSWGLTQKILSGEKTIESRWYMARFAPWDRVRRGDTVYFKDSGEPVTIKAEVSRVIQFSDLTPKKVKQILAEHAAADGIESRVPEFFRLLRDKRYCILVFLRNAKRVKPFDIDKSGFGMMSAWITVDSIKSIA